MFGSRSNFNEQWQLKRKRLVRHEPKSLQPRENIEPRVHWKKPPKWSLNRHLLFRYSFSYTATTIQIEMINNSCLDHTVTIPSNPQLDRSGKEFNHHLSGSTGTVSNVQTGKSHQDTTTNSLWYPSNRVREGKDEGGKNRKRWGSSSARGGWCSNDSWILWMIFRFQNLQKFNGMFNET